MARTFAISVLAIFLGSLPRCSLRRLRSVSVLGCPLSHRLTPEPTREPQRSGGVQLGSIPTQHALFDHGADEQE